MYNQLDHQTHNLSLRKQTIYHCIVWAPNLVIPKDNETDVVMLNP